MGLLKRRLGADALAVHWCGLPLVRASPPCLHCLCWALPIVDSSFHPCSCIPLFLYFSFVYSFVPVFLCSCISLFLYFFRYSFGPLHSRVPRHVRYTLYMNMLCVSHWEGSHSCGVGAMAGGIFGTNTPNRTPNHTPTAPLPPTDKTLYTMTYLAWMDVRI